MHVTKVCFIQLVHKIKYVEFEDRLTNFFYKNLLECENFSARRLIKECPTKNWKIRTLDDFLRKLRTTGSIERNVSSVVKYYKQYLVFVGFQILSLTPCVFNFHYDDGATTEYQI